MSLHLLPGSFAGAWSNSSLYVFVVVFVFLFVPLYEEGEPSESLLDEQVKKYQVWQPNSIANLRYKDGVPGFWGEGEMVRMKQTKGTANSFSIKTCWSSKISS